MPWVTGTTWLWAEGQQGEGAGATLCTPPQALRTMLGHSMGGHGAPATGQGALAGCAQVVPCPQADAPLLLRLEDMSSRLKDISTRRRGCSGWGNAQQEGTGTGHVRDERRSQFMLECKYGSGTPLRGARRPPPGPGTRARAACNSSDLVHATGRQSSHLAWPLCRGEEEEGQAPLQQPSPTAAAPALHGEVPRVARPLAEGWSLSYPLIILRINSSISSPPGCAEQQLGVKRGTSQPD